MKIVLTGNKDLVVDVLLERIVGGIKIVINGSDDARTISDCGISLDAPDTTNINVDGRVSQLFVVTTHDCDEEDLDSSDSDKCCYVAIVSESVAENEILDDSVLLKIDDDDGYLCVLIPTTSLNVIDVIDSYGDADNI